MRGFLIALLLGSAAATQAYAAPEGQTPQQNREANANAARQERAKATEARRTAREQSRVQPARPNPRPQVQVQRPPQTRPPIQPQVQNRPVSRPVNRPPNVATVRPPVVSTVPRFGAQPPVRVQSRPAPQPQWSTNWRNYQRYDWGDYRRRHRSLYHQHRYRDPFGWGYQLFSIGWRLWPNYYSSNYWIYDPWMYRLPPAPPGTRWIRYYNDALLVDMWSGEVIDVIHGFFW